MKPCYLCHRKAVHQTQLGALCAPCFEDAVQDQREQLQDGEDEAPEVCVFGSDQDCHCSECRLIADFERALP